MDLAYHHFTKLDSTNNCAKRNAHLLGENKLTVIVADEQLAGRGRSTRIWHSPSKLNVYVSFCHLVEKNERDLSNYSQLLTITGSELMQQMGFEVKLKWPNDIHLSGKKVSGVLCEVVSLSNGKQCVINGIGINVNMAHQQVRDIPLPATSLLLEGGSPRNPTEILDLLVARYLSNLQVFKREGFRPFLGAFRSFIKHQPNDPISFHQHNQVINGLFHSINDDGSLNLLLEDGTIKRCLSGELR